MGKLGLALFCSCSVGKAMLSKSLIQCSVDGWDCVPSLLFDLRPKYGGGNEDNGTQTTTTTKHKRNNKCKLRSTRGASTL